MNKVYVVIVSDKHCDDNLILRRQKEDAIKEAENATAAMSDHYKAADGDVDRDLNDSMRRAGWVYYASLEDVRKRQD